MKPALAPLENEWLPKLAAAKLLGVATRQLERRTRQGYIESRREPRQVNQTTAPVLYSKADILALKAGTPNVHAREVPAADAAEADRPVSTRLKTSQNGSNGSNGSTALAVRDARDPFAGLAAQLAGLATFAAQYPAPAAPRPWLTLAEAVEYSGLTRPWLLDRAKAGGIAIRDMGKHSRGGRWRFNREELARAGK